MRFVSERLGVSPTLTELATASDDLSPHPLDALHIIAQHEGQAVLRTIRSGRRRQTVKWVAAAAAHKAWKRLNPADRIAWIAAEYPFAEAPYVEAESFDTLHAETQPKVLAEDPFWYHGHETLQRPDISTLRRHLRHNRAVVNEMQKWWETALRSSRAAKEEEFISRTAYVSLVRKIIKATIQSAYADEWDADVHDTVLHYEQFCDAIYEHVDLWTKSADPVEYVEFLRSLFKSIATMQGRPNKSEARDKVHFWHQAQVGDGRHYIWKADRDIVYVGSEFSAVDAAIDNALRQQLDGEQMGVPFSFDAGDHPQDPQEALRRRDAGANVSRPPRAAQVHLTQPWLSAHAEQVQQVQAREEALQAPIELKGMSPTACDESHRLRAPRPSCESMELSSESHEATRAAEASVSTVDITQEVEDPTIMHRAESAESATALARVAPRLPVPQPSSAAPSAASSTQVEVEPKRNDGISVADHHSRANENGHGEVVPVQQAAAQEERVTEEEPAPMDSVPPPVAPGVVWAEVSPDVQDRPKPSPSPKPTMPRSPPRPRSPPPRPKSPPWPKSPTMASAMAKRLPDDAAKHRAPPEGGTQASMAERPTSAQRLMGSTERRRLPRPNSAPILSGLGGPAAKADASNLSVVGQQWSGTAPTTTALYRARPGRFAHGLATERALAEFYHSRTRKPIELGEEVFRLAPPPSPRTVVSDASVAMSMSTRPRAQAGQRAAQAAPTLPLPPWELRQLAKFRAQTDKVRRGLGTYQSTLLRGDVRAARHELKQYVDQQTRVKSHDGVSGNLQKRASSSSSLDPPAYRKSPVVAFPAGWKDDSVGR